MNNPLLIFRDAKAEEQGKPKTGQVAEYSAVEKWISHGSSKTSIQ